MPHLYIANCSKQDNAFTYRMPEQARGHHKVDILAGAQVRLANLSPEAVKSIVEAHEPYGMRHFKKASKEKGFVGLVYSDEGEINWDGISAVMDHNKDVLAKKGKELREAAAVTADSSLLNNAPAGSELKGTDVEIVEVEHKDREMTAINEKMEVRPAPDDKTPRRGNKTPERSR